MQQFNTSDDRPLQTGKADTAIGPTLKMTAGAQPPFILGSELHAELLTPQEQADIDKAAVQRLTAFAGSLPDFASMGLDGQAADTLRSGLIADFNARQRLITASQVLALTAPRINDGRTGADRWFVDNVEQTGSQIAREVNVSIPARSVYLYGVHDADALRTALHDTDWRITGERDNRYGTGKTLTVALPLTWNGRTAAEIDNLADARTFMAADDNDETVRQHREAIIAHNGGCIDYTSEMLESRLQQLSDAFVRSQTLDNNPRFKAKLDSVALCLVGDRADDLVEDLTNPTLEPEEFLDNLKDYLSEAEGMDLQTVAGRVSDRPADEGISGGRSFREVIGADAAEDIDPVLEDDWVKNLTPSDIRTQQDLADTLRKTFPDGMAWQVKDFSLSTVYCMTYYMQPDELESLPLSRQSPVSYPDDGELLKAEIRLRPDDYAKVMGAEEHYYNSDIHRYILDRNDVSEDADVCATVMLRRHPDLLGARITMEINEMSRHLYIEGVHFDRARAWLLQAPDLTKADFLRLARDPQAREEFLRSHAEMDNGLRYRKGYNSVVFFRDGIDGIVEVDHYRGVRASGQALPQEDMDRIMDFALNRNMQVDGTRHLFFYKPGGDAESRLYHDTYSGTAHHVHVQKAYDGGTFLTEGRGGMLFDADHPRYKDITGRITDAAIVNSPTGGISVRCRIDGVQQMSRLLSQGDLIFLGGVKEGTPDMDRFALNMAVKHFSGDITQSYDRERGPKR